MLRRFFANNQPQQTAPIARPQSKREPATGPQPVYSPARPYKRRPIPWYGWLSIIVLMILGLSALGLFAYQTWEFVSWLFPNESFGYRILALVNFDIFSTVWLCLHLFVILRHGAKVASVIAGGIDLLLSLLCTVIELMRQATEQLYGNYKPDANLIATGMAVVVIALLVNFIALLSVLYAQWPYISGQAYENEEEPVYSPPQTQVQPVYSQGQPSQDINGMLLTYVLAQLQGSMQQAPAPLASPQQQPASFQQSAAPAARQTRARKEPVEAGEASGASTRTKKSLPKLRTT